MIHDVVKDSEFTNEYGGLSLVRFNDKLYLCMEDCFRDKYFGPLTNAQVTAFNLICDVQETNVGDEDPTGQVIRHRDTKGEEMNRLYHVEFRIYIDEHLFPIANLVFAQDEEEAIEIATLIADKCINGAQDYGYNARNRGATVREFKPVKASAIDTN